MAKFYVQSGLFTSIVQAQDPEGAVLWATHQYLNGLPTIGLGLATGIQDSAPRATSNSMDQKPTADRHEDRGLVIQFSQKSPAQTASFAAPAPAEAELAGTWRISQIGFGRAECGEFLTDDVLQKYLELLSALEQL